MPPYLKSVTSLEQALPSHNFIQSATEAIKLFTKSYSTFFPAIKMSQYLSSGCFTPINLLLLTLILIKQRPRLLHHLSIRVPRFLVSDMWVLFEYVDVQTALVVVVESSYSSFRIFFEVFFKHGAWHLPCIHLKTSWAVWLEKILNSELVFKCLSLSFVKHRLHDVWFQKEYTLENSGLK